MPVHHWTLTDVASNTFVETFSAAIAGAGSLAGSVEKKTLRGGVSDRVDVLTIDNGRLAFSILPTRGMGLYRGTCDGLSLGWNSPVRQPVHPAFVDQQARGGIGWLTGFNEWLCRCGLDANGPPGDGATLHGRIANIPAHQVSVELDTDGVGEIRIVGVVDETMLFGPCLRLKTTISTKLGSTELLIVDEVTNLAGRPADLELLYHTQFGPPFLEAGAVVELAAKSIVPRDQRAAEGIESWNRFLGPTPGYAEQVYYFALAADAAGETRVLLRNQASSCGVSLGFNVQELPCFALWKNTQAEADGYCVGLEPATNFPNLKSYERKQGRVVQLSAGETKRFELSIAVHSDSASVDAVRGQLTKLQGGTKATVYSEPQAGWSK